ncbi:MAG TPA: type IV pilus twitching motility protein PilT [Candidatus Binatia bacterium]|jgi:twitching motility protein PilT|nr:type IV pilus twitching motility protein PilT [Candidatus Binatia bacterium]
MDITQLLAFGVEQGASDCHLSSEEPPMLRIHGDLKKLDHAALSKEQVHAMVYDIMNDGQRKVFEETHEADFSFEMGNIARFRVNVFMQRKGEGAVFRTIPTKILTLEQLGMPPVLKHICDKEKGLVLVTGPTGSGKSTTLAGMIDYLNNSFEGHILTIEDPIEFVHQSKKCLVNQRELGPHTHSFANALRAALREDPDIILVGEMRDLDTIQLALTAAETGHLVFGTLHTSSAPKTVDRVIDVFPPNQQSQIRAQFSESIEAVMTQTLLKKKGGGRVAALEIMTGTTAIRNLIREGKIHQIPGTMQVSQKDGMQTMDMALMELVNRGMVTKEEAQSRSMNPNLFGALGVAGTAGRAQSR